MTTTPWTKLSTQQKATVYVFYVFSFCVVVQEVVGMPLTTRSTIAGIWLPAPPILYPLHVKVSNSNEKTSSEA